MDFHNISRRQFVLAATAAAAGISYSGPPELRGRGGFACDNGPLFTSACAAAPARKLVTIGGRRARVVDIHAHCVIPRAEELLRGTTVSGDFPAAQVLSPTRIQAMDQRGIDVQVLSINGYWWYSAERELASRIVRTHDEGIAEWCRAHSDRFVALSSVALQHPDLAAQQLEHAVR